MKKEFSMALIRILAALTLVYSISAQANQQCIRTLVEARSNFGPQVAEIAINEEQLKTLAKRLEIRLYRKEVEMRKVFLQKGYDQKRGFSRLSGQAYWKFRVKTDNAILSKLKQAIAQGLPLNTIEDAERIITDGLGARLVIQNPTPDALDSFVKDLLELIASREVSVLEIDNYSAIPGHSYLSTAHIATLVQAQKDQGPEALVLQGNQNNFEADFTSVQMKLRLPSGSIVELQVRGSILEQLAEVAHIFYDHLQGKEPSLEVNDNYILQGNVRLMKRMSVDQERAYAKYLRKAFKLVRRYNLGKSLEGLAWPTELRGFESLKVEALARALDLRMIADLVESPQSFDHKQKRYHYIDSLKLLTTTLDDHTLEKVLGNVSQGSLVRRRVEKAHSNRQALLAQLQGLNYVEAIVWEESIFLWRRRAVIRSGREWPEEVQIPEYLTGQPTGPKKVRIRDLHYMQDSANNSSGQYTVVGNAQQLRTGSLKVTDLPPLKVWRDETGKIWSLDHRRLAAFELSGVVDEVEVIFVKKEEVDDDRFKLSNSDGGRSIIIHLPENRQAYIIAKPD